MKVEMRIAAILLISMVTHGAPAATLSTAVFADGPAYCRNADSTNTRQFSESVCQDFKTQSGGIVEGSISAFTSPGYVTANAEITLHDTQSLYGTIEYVGAAATYSDNFFVSNAPSSGYVNFQVAYNAGGAINCNSSAYVCGNSSANVYLGPSTGVSGSGTLELGENYQFGEGGITLTLNLYGRCLGGGVNDASCNALMAGTFAIKNYKVFDARGNEVDGAIVIDSAGIDYKDVAPVPLPAAAWLLLSGLPGLAFVTRKRPAY